MGDYEPQFNDREDGFTIECGANGARDFHEFKPAFQKKARGAPDKGYISEIKSI